MSSSIFIASLLTAGILPLLGLVAPAEPAAPAPKSDGEWQKSASGLEIQDVQVGEGAEAKSGATVDVHYTGWLEDGTEFDSSRKRGKPFSFKLGAGQVIKGWDEGVKGMKVGGSRKLRIPPALGYGSRGASGVIPGNATLLFDVELVAVR